MATLVLKEMGKFLWEVREKSLPCWLRQPPGQTFFPTFPKEFSHFLQNAKKGSGIMKSGLDAMPLFLLDNLLISKVRFGKMVLL